MSVFGRICMTYIGFTIERFCGVWVCKYTTFYYMMLGSLCKKDGGRIKICGTFSGNSLKEDLSIDTTFDPCYFSWDCPFNPSFCFFYSTFPLYNGPTLLPPNSPLPHAPTLPSFFMSMWLLPLLCIMDCLFWILPFFLIYNSSSWSY